MTLDQSALDHFLGRFVTDLGATAAAASVVIGHRLGLYRAMAEGPASSAELADRTGTQVRPVTEWLRGQAASGYVTFDAGTDLFRLTEEQAFCLADPDGPLYLPGAFLLALGALRAERRITESFRTGTGVGWHEQDRDVFLGCDAFFRPGYVANLTSSWIPALDGVDAALRAGDRALGNQAGPRALEEVTREAGLTRFRRATSTPFNDVYEVRR